MIQNTNSKAQKDSSPDYKRLRFKKLIPQLISEDFNIPIRDWVKNKILNVDIHQGRSFYSFSVRKSRDEFILSYRNTQNRYASYSGEDYRFKTVSELYSFAKEKLKKDGLLTREELMVKDIIV